MREFDKHEKSMLAEIIRNPRISDNNISKKTGISVMTVNRKRKRLQKEGILSYYASVDLGESGARKFMEKQLYIVSFRSDITRKIYLDTVEKDKKFQQFNACYIEDSYLGERDGRLALILLLVSRSSSEMTDIFGGIIVPHLKQMLGEDAVREINTTKIIRTVRRLHNYLPGINRQDGIISSDWPDDWIFIDEERAEDLKQKKLL